MQAERWLNKPKSERQRLLSKIPFDNPEFLDIVRAPAGWGVLASAGPHFRHAIFGRDSIAVALDLLDKHQQLAHDIIHALARLQGNSTVEKNEEEPGKVHHEFRTTRFDGITVPQESLKIMRHQQEVWGDAGPDQMIYYGSFDATPLYIRLVSEYTAAYGNDILNEGYTDRSGNRGTIGGSVLFAAEWLAQKVRARADHLFMYKRTSPTGFVNQAWKDSQTSYIFSDGSLPDFDKGVVSVELQAYAYDALRQAAKLSTERSAEYNQLANDIQQATIDKIWMPEEKYFAQGIATDNSGQERQIDTITSNAGLLLDSNLLRDLPEEQRGEYVQGIVNTVLGDQLRTEAGIRCRATRHSGLPGYVDYHGSHTVWPRETFAIARGLKRCGFARESQDLLKSLVNSVQKAGEFSEFFYVEDDGTLWYDALEGIQHFTPLTSDVPLAIPEPGQAWTISAAIAASYQIATKS